jgi:hypothetical protein
MLVCVFGLAAVAGCPIAESTTVEFTNEAIESTVRVTLYYSDEQNIPEELLEEARLHELELAPGETRTFTRDCDEIQAVMVDADLRLFGTPVGPEARSEIFRDGSDFGCGDTIRFTFVPDAVGTQLDIRFSQEN